MQEKSSEDVSTETAGIFFPQDQWLPAKTQHVQCDMVDGFEGNTGIQRDLVRASQAWSKSKYFMHPKEKKYRCLQHRVTGEKEQNNDMASALLPGEFEKFPNSFTNGHTTGKCDYCVQPVENY